MLTDMLVTAASDGSAHALSSAGIPVAGKTGTVSGRRRQHARRLDGGLHARPRTDGVGMGFDQPDAAHRLSASEGAQRRARRRGSAPGCCRLSRGELSGAGVLEQPDTVRTALLDATVAGTRCRSPRHPRRRPADCTVAELFHADHMPTEFSTEWNAPAAGRRSGADLRSRRDAGTLVHRTRCKTPSTCSCAQSTGHTENHRRADRLARRGNPLCGRIPRPAPPRALFRPAAARGALRARHAAHGQRKAPPWNIPPAARWTGCSAPARQAPHRSPRKLRSTKFSRCSADQRVAAPRHRPTAAIRSSRRRSRRRARGGEDVGRRDGRGPSGSLRSAHPRSCAGSRGRSGTRAVLQVGAFATDELHGAVVDRQLDAALGKPRAIPDPSAGGRCGRSRPQSAHGRR